MRLIRGVRSFKLSQNCHCREKFPLRGTSHMQLVFATDPAKFLESTEVDVTATL